MKLYCIGFNEQGLPVMINDDLKRVDDYIERVFKHDHDVKQVVFKRCREDDFYSTEVTEAYTRVGKQVFISNPFLCDTK